MLSPETSPASASRFLGVRWWLGPALLATAIVAAPGMARAETGGALPPGYTSDVPAQPGAPAQPVQVRRVSDTDDDADDYADTDPSALTDFREPLDPYGQWVEDPNYGTVWVPSSAVVGADFAPYQTAGHWALDDNEDWMWVSDYDWGYVPFHYGRWVWIAGTGWSWIPGRVYAPAWVSWRVGDGGYMGWAPMPPTWYWSGGYAVGLWVQPYAAFCFVPTAYMFDEHVYYHVVRDPAVVRGAAASTRPYKPATPGVGGSHAGGTSHGFRTASPRLNEAGIAASVAPKSHTAPDARARNFASRSSTAAVRRQFAPNAARGMSAAPSHRGVANNSPWQTHQPSFDRARPSFDNRSIDRSAPVYDRGTRSFDSGSRAFDSRTTGPVLRTPTRDFPSSPRFSSPSYPSAPAFRPSAPSFRPSAPSFRPSAPAAPSFRPSAPSFRPSAPSFRPSAPAHFGGGGGRHR